MPAAPCPERYQNSLGWATMADVLGGPSLQQTTGPISHQNFSLPQLLVNYNTRGQVPGKIKLCNHISANTQNVIHQLQRMGWKMSHENLMVAKNEPPSCAKKYNLKNITVHSCFLLVFDYIETEGFEQCVKFSHFLGIRV